jgi:hypothetical protein
MGEEIGRRWQSPYISNTNAAKKCPAFPYAFLELVYSALCVIEPHHFRLIFIQLRSSPGELSIPRNHRIHDFHLTSNFCTWV